MIRTQASIPDTVFFPLAAALAAALVYFAIDPFADRPPRGPLSGGGRNAEDVTMKGRELNRFNTGDFGGLTIEPAGPKGRDTLVRIDRQADQTYQDPRSGPHIVLAEDLETAFESRPIEVLIEARNTGDFGASFFEADYFARAGSESGWQRFPLSSEWQTFSFTWFPPKKDGLGNDYIGVRPVAPDKHRMMEIRSIRIHATGAKQAPPPSATPTGVAPIP